MKWIQPLIIFILLFAILPPITSSEGSVESIQFNVVFRQPVISQSRICIEPANHYLYVPGYPILPVYRKTILLPPSARDITVKCEVMGIKHLNLSSVKRCPDPFPKILERINFSLDKWFDYEIGRGLYGGKDHIILTISIYPVRYVGERAFTIKEAKVRIDYEICSQSSVERKDKMLIITPKEFLDVVENFASQKRIDTVISTLDYIYNTSSGRDNAEKVKTFIKRAVDKEGIKYVLLIGGKEKLPARYIVSHFSYFSYQFLFISDLYYADLYDANGSFCSWDTNGNSLFGEFNETSIIDKADFYPDVYLGRLPCNDKEELTNVLHKILAYENIAKGDWFKRIILCGGNTWPTLGLFSANDLLYSLLYKGTIVNEGEYMGDVASNYMKGFDPIRIYASGIVRKDAIPLTRKNINEAINGGAGFIFFAGHGTPTSWATHPPLFKRIWLPFPFGYRTSDVQLLRNDLKLPIVVFSACLCADFDTVRNPIAWEFLRHRDGGGIACYASTTVAMLYPTDICTESLNGFISLDIFKLYAEGRKTAGELWGDSIVDYINEGLSGYIPNDFLTFTEWELFGDPSLRIG